MKTVLVTGGSGFLGRQLGLRLRDQYRVVLAARNNNQNNIAQRLTGCDTAPLDVTDIESVRDVFAEFRPNIVIHAAATKYVDLSEKFPNECIDVNVKGSQNVARVSVEKAVDIVVGISTDKAAPPCRSTYGLSKAIMERILCSMNGKAHTRYTNVRFGNIAWSTGSVLPIWKTMLEQDGLIKTTGPHMRRFLFSVEDAARLVIRALDQIDLTAGRVLCQKMKAVQIEDMLKAYVALHKGRYQRVDECPGESLDETLVGESELAYTREINLDGGGHYLISFNEKAETRVAAVVNSGNAERLSAEEIMEIVSNPPKDC